MKKANYDKFYQYCIQNQLAFHELPNTVGVTNVMELEDENKKEINLKKCRDQWNNKKNEKKTIDENKEQHPIFKDVKKLITKIENEFLI